MLMLILFCLGLRVGRPNRFGLSLEASEAWILPATITIWAVFIYLDLIGPVLMFYKFSSWQHEQL